MLNVDWTKSTINKNKNKTKQKQEQTQTSKQNIFENGERIVHVTNFFWSTNCSVDF